VGGGKGRDVEVWVGVGEEGGLGSGSGGRVGGGGGGAGGRGAGGGGGVEGFAGQGGGDGDLELGGGVVSGASETAPRNGLERTWNLLSSVI